LNDTEAFVRRESAKALGKLKDEKAVEPLIKLLKDPVYKVRADAATALKEIGDDRAVAPMIEVLDSHGGGWYWSADFFIKDAILKFKNRRKGRTLVKMEKEIHEDIKFSTISSPTCHFVPRGETSCLKVKNSERASF
jgi:HEAT repeat protein